MDGPPPAVSIVCKTDGTHDDPCVLTGQNSRSRTSTNTHETTLAGFSTTQASTFGMASLYAYGSSDHPSGYGYTPTFAQPLYITYIPNLSGTGFVNLVIAANLNNTVYAWNSSTGSQVWSTHLNDCGGGPFINNVNRVPGAAGLPYYGIVSTPVIDTSPAPPVAFVVYACETSTTAYQWWLDAVDVKNGSVLATKQITDPSFKAYNELSRAALLLTHPISTQTDVYVTFAAGIKETEAGNGSQYAYSGVVVGYSVIYSSSGPTYVSFTKLASPFYDSGFTTAAFPPVYTNYDTGGAPTGPSCVTSTGSNYCDQGDNWAVNGGGSWMSGKGPASDGSANVYLTTGNGPFGCTSTGFGQNSCTDVTQVEYFGESEIAFPAATATALGSPSDFYTPGVNTLKNIKPGLDPNPAAYEFQELNRLDQDFGTPGLILMEHSGGTTFAATADKTGYLYVNGTASLGRFTATDAGLMQSFQGSRYPSSLNESPCPTQNTSPSGTYSGNDCDEIHELAWWNDFLYAWPEGETLLSFQGTVAGGGSTYSFGSAWDPCSVTGNCTGTVPRFPTANYPGASMSIAANGVGVLGTQGSLWSIVPETVNGNPQAGLLYAYSVDTTAGHLTYLWDSNTGQNCTAPPAHAWFASSFAEPTLAAGSAYVPTYCIVTGTGGPYSGCAAAASAGAAASGVLVYSHCN